METQRLLFPLSLEWANAEDWAQHEELLERLGFQLRELKGGRLQLVSQPAVLKRGQKEVIEKILECRENVDELVASDVLATLACHSAVRAHDRLSREEIDRLLKDFSSEDSLGHCPHGRPTFVRFQNRDFEKLFHRVL